MSRAGRVWRVYVPLTAVLAAVVIAVALVQGSGGSGPHGPRLRVIDSRVGEVREGGHLMPYVSVKLQNRGDRRADLTRLHMTFFHADPLESCQLLSHGGTPKAGRYAVELPELPRLGQRLEQGLDQEMAADGTGRLRVVFATPELEHGMVDMYEIGLSAETAGSPKRLPIGRFLLMTPEPASSATRGLWFANPAESRVLTRSFHTPASMQPESCYNRNTVGFRTFLESTATRSRRTAAMVDEVRQLTKELGA